MKAVIVEIKNKTAAVLLADGQVIKIKNRSYDIGQQIELEEKQASGAKRLAVRVASMVAVMAIGSASAFAYYTPYYYVSLDVNPSFEYAVNYFDRVLSASALDENTTLDDAELKKLDNKNIRQAIADTVEQIREEGYFDAGENGILIAVSGKNGEKADRLGESLQQVVRTNTDDSEHVEIETSNVQKEDVQEARDLGVSAGKLNLVEKLEESAEAGEIDREEWISKPVIEIMDAIKENKKEEKQEGKDSEEKEKEKKNENTPKNEVKLP